MEKVRAAICARSDRDFIVITRCHAPSVAGMDDVVQRVPAYQQVGVDMLFRESARSIQEVTAIPQRLPGTH